ncbi:MAG TPA: epoxyqueuosine reductase QueH [Syntrophales bacterium]|nr:epoxyqueuosine reductase QueH [Syntrophales bacterium]HOX95394.1 epoxyqueuosine reductase QueH [Syntrophales bacterium]HPI56443.1 epoxyqueuosine reductase QueH [Syntrophales bacterium]HPN24169.1 epoxyqueuosine reductase QueH [Syntrophales bacterium]HQM28522.1 epoxyqueuosine reductase QueH [Syntrophales bacterium]
MKLLLHICCAPCTIYPLDILRKEEGKIEGLFFNPNIHPYLEYRKRLETLQEFAKHEGLAVEEAEDYPMEEFLRETIGLGEDRCRYCYEVRLRRTAAHALKGYFDAFTTTLLYSRYQKHDLIRRTGEAIAREMKVPFYYADFRVGWEEGVRRSRETGMYRQKYCGCIFSEKERFYKGE